MKRDPSQVLSSGSSRIRIQEISGELSVSNNPNVNRLLKKEKERMKKVLESYEITFSEMEEELLQEKYEKNGYIERL